MKSISVSNIRLGFACNSSSSHSILLAQPAHAPDEMCESRNFGWEFFTAASPEARTDYFHILLKSNISEIVGYEAGAEIARALYGVDPEWYVDHQSVWVLPRTWDERWIDPVFCSEAKTFLLRPDIIVLGGNDNEDPQHPLIERGQGTLWNYPIEDDRGARLVAKKSGDWWTLFNRSTGAKVRLSFMPTPEPFLKSESPELVDIKITDYCPFSCSHCYQNSSVTGQHADTHYIKELLYGLAEARCFEVALGGGEPTLHPDIEEIVEYAHDCHLIPNITTRNYGWLGSKQYEQVAPLLGAVAVSEDRVFGEAIRAIMKTSDPSKCILQTIEGQTRADDFGRLMDTCGILGIRQSVLGFKQSGRATKPRYNCQDHCLLPAVQKHNGMDLSVDTAFILQHKDTITDAFLPQSYADNEGVSSCYVDAVNQTINVSSYSQRPPVPLSNPKDICGLFRNILPE